MVPVTLYFLGEENFELVDTYTSYPVAVFLAHNAFRDFDPAVRLLIFTCGGLVAVRTLSAGPL